MWMCVDIYMYIYIYNNSVCVQITTNVFLRVQIETI